VFTKNKCLFRFDSCLTLQKSFFFSFDIVVLLYRFRFFSLYFAFLLYLFRFISLDFVFLPYRFRFISLDFVFLFYRFRWILFSFRFVSFRFSAYRYPCQWSINYHAYEVRAIARTIVHRKPHSSTKLALLPELTFARIYDFMIRL
jgi:hypothetical protein